MLAEKELNNLVYGIEGFKRGMIAWVNFDGSNSVQKGIRPALIIQNDIGNKYAPTLIVTPLTSRKKKDMPTHLLLLKEKYTFLKNDSIVLLEQIVTVPKEKVGDYIGRIDIRDIAKLNRPISISLGLIEAQRNPVDIALLQTIKERSKEIEDLDVFIKIWLDRNGSLESIEDVLNNRQEYIKNLDNLCMKNGLKMETFYSLKAVGAISNENRGIRAM